MTAENGGQHGRGTAKRYVVKVDSSPRFEKLACQVKHTSDGGYPNVYFARIRLRVGNELGNRRRRKGRICDQNARILRQARDRNEVADDVEFQIVEKGCINRARSGHKDERVAVG